MSTRSIVAQRLSDGGWKGRYVHFDGYPDGVGEAVKQIVTRDGVETAVKTLLFDHYGWSQVTGETEDLSYYQLDGRFESVPNYGIAYTTVQNQTSEDEWYSSEEPNALTWIDYVHVIEDDGTVTSFINPVDA